MPSSNAGDFSELPHPRSANPYSVDWGVVEAQRNQRVNQEFSDMRRETEVLHSLLSAAHERVSASEAELSRVTALNESLIKVNRTEKRYRLMEIEERDAEAAARDADPIGKRVRAKSTGAGPYIAMAEVITEVKVSAMTDRTQRLEAYIVRDRKGRFLPLPKADIEILGPVPSVRTDHVGWFLTSVLGLLTGTIAFLVLQSAVGY